ncbi:MAG: polysaccharide pyruvyl transferase family protein [Bacteroidales bacterium]|nr:polysaccharide pyruvyl transferase family protein [Bacteroidales bacterium]
MKIALLGLHTDSNLGDPLICETVKALYDKYEDDAIEWKFVNLRKFSQFMPRSPYYFFIKKTCGLLNRLNRKVNLKFLYEMRVHLSSLLMDYYIKGQDKAIIAGGGIIHYKFHDYCLGISSFIKSASRHKVPVVINAVGIEGYDSSNVRCLVFTKYLSYPNVKFISTRDDIEVLRKNYLNSQSCASIAKVVDPVIFCSKLFNINSPKTECIGIGLIRKSIFKDYQLNYPPNYLVDFYCQLAISLEKKGVEYCFFSNGLASDGDIISDIESSLGRKINVVIPTSTESLMSVISQFRGIITARMHSCIVAYSYNVPAVAINWCDKIKFWMKNINKEYCCMELDELDAEQAIELLLKSVQEGYDDTLRTKLENNAIDMIKKSICLSSIGSNRCL